MLLLLYLLLLYVRLVIMNKVDLIFTRATITIRCPDGQISYIGWVASVNTLDNLRSYCSQPYLLSSDNSINIFTVNALLGKCINKKDLEMKFKLDLTNTHKSIKHKPSSISIHTDKPGLTEKFKETSSKSSINKNYIVTVGENIKLNSLNGGKEHHTFYVWFIERDWIICRLHIYYNSHPCHHNTAHHDGDFLVFCYYNINAIAPMSIEELNEVYNQTLNEKKTTEDNTNLLRIINNNSQNKKSKSISQKNIKKNKHSQKQKKNSNSFLTFIQTNLIIIIVVTICLLILFILSAIYFYKQKKQVAEEEQEEEGEGKDLNIESEKSSIDSDKSIISNEILENPVPLKEQMTSVNVPSNHLDDIE